MRPRLSIQGALYRGGTRSTPIPSKRLIGRKLHSSRQLFPQEALHPRPNLDSICTRGQRVFANLRRRLLGGFRFYIGRLENTVAGVQQVTAKVRHLCSRPVVQYDRASYLRSRNRERGFRRRVSKFSSGTARLFAELQAACTQIDRHPPRMSRQGFRCLIH